MKREDQSHLRQEEIREILGVVPPWILRWGMLVLFLVFALLFLGAYWFQYPDRIQSQISITTLNPPVEINARKEGRIKAWQVHDGQGVVKGQLLAVLESSAEYQDMLELEPALDRFRQQLAGEIHPDSILFPFEVIRLGEWQPGFARFQKARQELIEFLKQDSYQLKIKALRKQASDYRLLYDRQNQQRLIRNEELILEEKQFNRIQELHHSGAVSAAEFENAKSRFLKASYELESARTLLAQSQIQIDQFHNQAVDLQKEYEELRAAKVNSLVEALDMLVGSVQDWKLGYAFFSPVDGTVSLTRFWSENQAVKQGDRIMTILTGEPGPLTGRLSLPLRGAGKVQAGQRVLVRIDRYPYMEFGMLTGLVESVSQVADQDFYSVEVGFPGGLTTTYRKNLELSQGMIGTAEIITGEMSLLVRIINPLRNLISRNRPL